MDPVIEPMNFLLKHGGYSIAAVDGSEIPNNHLGSKQKHVNNGINYQPQLVRRISEPSTVSGWWFQFFFFHPYLGKISNLTNIFQMG